MSSQKTVIATAEAPSAIGPYSQALAVPAGAALVFCSGQIALSPQTGQLIKGDVVAQAEQVMRNLEAVLKAAGCDFSHVVKTTIFLSDLANFATVNGLYAQVFQHEPPARSTVQVAALPKGGLVEIEFIALLDD